MINKLRLHVVVAAALILLSTSLCRSETIVYPQIRAINEIDDAFQLKENNYIFYDDASKKNAEILAAELEKATGVEFTLALHSDVSGAGRKGVLLKITSKVDISGWSGPKIIPQEGYVITADRTGVSISASDTGGQLYGIIVLLQIVDEDLLTVPAATIIDHPTMAFRGLRGHLPKNTPQEIEHFKRVIRAMAFCRLNHLWIRDLYVRRFPASLEWRSRPRISEKDALSQDTAKTLMAYAARFNIKIMGSLAAVADNVWSIYPELIEMKPGETPFEVAVEEERGRTGRYRYGSRFNLCPSKKGTYRLLFDLIDEMAPLFTSDIIDLGVDEVDQDYNGSRWVADEACRGKESAPLFAGYVNRLADYVTAKGKTPLVNSTPFIKRHGGAFHGIYRSVAMIRKNIIINNWSDGHVRSSMKTWYRRNPQFTSSDYFGQYGLNRMVHLTGHQRRWQDRPELLEAKGKNDGEGAFVTHYRYMTDGTFAKSVTVDDMAFSANHFWTPNNPPIGSDADENQIAYGKAVLHSILNGSSFWKAIADARTRQGEMNQ